MDDTQRLLTYLDQDPALLQRLLLVAEPRPPVQVTTPEQAYEAVAPHLVGFPNERLVAVALDARRRILATEVLTVGSAGFTIVCPRQVLSWALRQGAGGASGVLLAHNHPSGDPTPSTQDVEVTRRVARAGAVVGVTVVDHLVVSRDRYSSIRESHPHLFVEVPTP